MYVEDGQALKDLFKHHSQIYLNEKLFLFDSNNLPSISCGSQMLQKVVWKQKIERAEDLNQSLVDFFNFIWSETIGSLEELLELSDDEASGKKVLKITNQQVRKRESNTTKKKRELT